MTKWDLAAIVALSALAVFAVYLAGSRNAYRANLAACESQTVECPDCPAQCARDLNDLAVCRMRLLVCRSVCEELAYGEPLTWCEVDDDGHDSIAGDLSGARPV